MGKDRRTARVVQCIVIAVFTAAMIYTALGITDSTPPTISMSGDVVVSLGESVPQDILEVSDNFTSREKIVVKIDTAQVDFNTCGVYDASASATDLNGNTCRCAFKVVVSVPKVDREALDAEISRIVTEHGISGTREDICRSVYRYIGDNLRYAPSDLGEDWVSAAYYGLMRDEGDCFVSLSLTRAFMEHFGIECIPVKRSEGYTVDTHYWCIVNIGDEASPLRYHLDCTRLSPYVSDMGCLMTDDQLESYCRYRAEVRGASEINFYAYDKEKYPDVEERIITELVIDNGG